MLQIFRSIQHEKVHRIFTCLSAMDMVCYIMRCEDTVTDQNISTPVLCMNEYFIKYEKYENMK